MESTTFIEMVNLIGFPIAACMALFYMNREQQKYHRELLTEFRSSIDNNTKAINHLMNQVEKG